MVVFSSEPQHFVDDAKRAWGLDKLRMIGDPHSSLARYVRHSGLINIVVGHPSDNAWNTGHPFMRYYTNGIAQPAVLVVDAQAKPLYTQATQPSLKNGGGAGDRASLPDVWELVKDSRKDSGAVGKNENAVRRLSLFGMAPLTSAILLFGPLVVVGAVVLTVRAVRRATSFKEAVLPIALFISFLVIAHKTVRAKVTKGL